LDWQKEWCDPILEHELKLGGCTVRLTVDESAYKIAGDVGGNNMHNHSRFEVHIILRGACRLDLEDSGISVRQGQAAVVGHGRYHRVVPETPDCQRLAIGIAMPECALRRAVSAALEARIVYPVTEEMLALCRSFMAEREQRPPFCRELMTARMAELAILLMRLLELPLDRTPATQEQRPPQNIIDNYFESRLDQNPCAEELAAYLHISRRQLNRVLQATYGMGFREKLLRNRMDQAKWLLRHTDKTVSAIAGEVGYTDDSSFRQAFRRQFHTTPQEYRLKHTQRQEESK